MGKGSNQRPTDMKKFDEEYARIFQNGDEWSKEEQDIISKRKVKSISYNKIKPKG